MIKWSTSNTNIATIDQNGLVKAVGKGTAIITAISSNKKEVKCTVNVLK